MPERPPSVEVLGVSGFADKLCSRSPDMSWHLLVQLFKVLLDTTLALLSYSRDLHREMETDTPNSSFFPPCCQFNSTCNLKYVRHIANPMITEVNVL